MENLFNKIKKTFSSENGSDIKKVATLAAGITVAATGVATENTKDFEKNDSLKKIEISVDNSQNNLPDAISWEDAQKMNEKIAQEIDSIQSLKTEAEKASIIYKEKIAGAMHTLDNIMKQLPRYKEYSGIYKDIEQFIQSSAVNYDLSTKIGFEKFVADMEKTVFDANQMKNYNPELAGKILALGKDYNSANFGINDLKIRNAKVSAEKVFLSNTCNDILVESHNEFQDTQIAMRNQNMNESNNDPLIMASK